MSNKGKNKLVGENTPDEIEMAGYVTDFYYLKMAEYRRKFGTKKFHFILGVALAMCVIDWGYEKDFFLGIGSLIEDDFDLKDKIKFITEGYTNEDYGYTKKKKT